MNAQVTTVCETVVFALDNVLRNSGRDPGPFSVTYATAYGEEHITIPLIEWMSHVNSWVSAAMGKMVVVLVPEDQISFVLVAVSVERLLSYCDALSPMQADPP
jgi:uncharacterized protein (DUF934 family)